MFEEFSEPGKCPINFVRDESSEKGGNPIILYRYKWKTSTIKYTNISLLTFFPFRAWLLYEHCDVHTPRDGGEPMVL